MMKLLGSLSFALFVFVPASSTNAYEVTTPYGNSVNAWAVCEPGNAPGGLYVWTRNDGLISDVNSNWYFIEDVDDGQLLRCGDSLDNLSPAVLIGSVPTPSAPAPLSTPAPVPAPLPTLPPVDSTSDIIIRSPWGRATGSWLICEVVDPFKHVPLTFAWERDGLTIAGASNIGYLINVDDEDAEITCSITTSAGTEVVSDPLFIDTIFEPPPTPSPVVAPISTTPAPVVTPAPQPPASTPAPIVVPPNNGKLDILDFTPHLAGDTPFSILPDETVRARVDLVAPYTNGIRTFACYNGLETIRYAKSLGMTTAAGAWMDNRPGPSQAELNCLINLAKEGVVDLAVVGSEVLTWNGLSSTQIVNYMQQFKTAVPDVPVTTAVKYEALIEAKNHRVIAACDIVYVNFYSFWSGYHIDQALSVLIQEYNDIVNLSEDKPVWISETGWPSNGSCANGAAVPNAANQERYLREVLEWAASQNIVVSWFDAFEALYKDGSEWCNVASHWGLFDAYGNIKPGPARVLT